MSKNNIVVPEAKDALERFKMEAASDLDVQRHIKIKFIKNLQLSKMLFT